MDGPALAMVLVAALIHATWNLAAKGVQGNGAQFVFLYASVSAAVCLPVAVVSVLVAGEHPEWTWLGAAAVTGVCHVLYGVALQRGYTVGDLSIVYPVARGTGPLLTVAVAVGFLGERPGLLGLAGALLIVTGVFIVGTAGRRQQRHLNPGGHRLGMLFGVLTGATIAAYTLWDNHSVNALAVPPIAYFALGVVVQAALLAPYAVGRATTGALWRERRLEVVVVGVLSPAAYLLVLFAMQRAPVALVAPAREISIVFGALAGWLILHEHHPVRRLAGAAVVVVGIAAIALA